MVEGMIYKIESKTGKMYIGSTKQTLKQRENGHKNGYNKYKTTGRGYCSSYKVYEEDEEARMILIEEYRCVRESTLRAREMYHIARYIEKGSTVVNENRPMKNVLRAKLEMWMKDELPEKARDKDDSKVVYVEL